MSENFDKLHENIEKMADKMNSNEYKELMESLSKIRENTAPHIRYLVISCGSSVFMDDNSTVVHNRLDSSIIYLQNTTLKEKTKDGKPHLISINKLNEMLEFREWKTLINSCCSSDVINLSDNDILFKDHELCYICQISE